MKLPPVLPDTNLWFILGREKELSAAEIVAVLHLKPEDFRITKNEPLLFCKPPIKPEAATLIKKLGGTIKIAEEIGVSLDRSELIKTIQNVLKDKSGKITFGLSVYGNLDTTELTRLGKEIKNNLKNNGLSVRFVPNREKTLSSATVDHNHLVGKGVEFIIYESSPQEFSLAKTLALQPYAEFSKRDFDRPGRDDKSGMLPPKLAMIMINLSESPKNDYLLDPFCGSGTIITEAMILGYQNLIGSDISTKAIDDTQTNIEWTKNNLNISCPEISLYNLDVKNLGEKIAHASIDRIVTEPFLGKPLNGQESYEELTKQSKMLKLLYLEAFRVFKKILRPDGVVVFVFPHYQKEDSIITTNQPREIEELGFTLLPFNNKEHLVYERPGQKVGREIWRFKKI
jgi:tRNA G10  N-methylase Trm11